MIIRVLKNSELGKPGHVIHKPTRPQIAFAKRNPSIARIIYEEEAKAPARTPRRIEPSYPPQRRTTGRKKPATKPDKDKEGGE